MRRVFFVDDNMIRNKKKAKELLAFIADYQAANGRPFTFGTEVSINLAQDEELMALMRAASFNWVFIGIESPDPASLKETGKTQNLREDLLTSVRRLYARGIEVLAGFIIGFDNDTPATFEAQYRFITDAGIQTAMIGLLTAAPKTPLYERVLHEGRLRDTDDETDNTRTRSNIIHKTMSDETVSRLYSDIYRRLLTDSGISTRIRNKLHYLSKRRYSGGYSLGQSLALVGRLLTRGILPGGPRRLYHFLRSFSLSRPSMVPTVISDWIAGLSMKAFARDHLWDAANAFDMSILESVQEAISRRLRLGEVWITRKAAAAPNLTIHLGDALNGRFFRTAAPQLRRLMKQSQARVTLAVDGMPARYAKQLDKLLARLADHGDRVFVVLSESLRERLTIDLTAYNLVLAPAPVRR